MELSTSKSFACSRCPRKFTDIHNRNRHVRQQHERTHITHTCDVCSRLFSTKYNLTQHKKIHMRDDTSQQSSSSRKRTQSLETSHSSSLNKKRKALEDHLASDEDGEYLSVDDVDHDEQNSEIQRLYRQHRQAIRTHHRRGRYQHLLNVQWPSDGSQVDWNDQLLKLFDEQQRRFKINLSHSFILYNQDTHGFRFCHASANNARVFDVPRVINNKNDFLTFLEELRETDSLEYARQRRPDTKWTVHHIAATSFYVTPITDFPIGCGSCIVPKALVDNKYVYTLTKDEHHNFVYQDNLCFFRCLALHQGASLHTLQRPTQELFKQWMNQIKQKEQDDCFRGITLENLPHIETLFKTDVDVFEWDVQNECLTPRRRSDHRFKNLLRIILVDETHCCYIKDIDRATCAFSCPKCKKLWKTNNLHGLERHEKTCTGNSVKHIYQGGVYHPEPSILDVLKQQGFSVDPSFVYPYRATFDFEVFFGSYPTRPNTQDPVYRQTCPAFRQSLFQCLYIPKPCLFYQPR